MSSPQQRDDRHATVEGKTGNKTIKQVHGVSTDVHLDSAKTTWDRSKSIKWKGRMDNQRSENIECGKNNASGSKVTFSECVIINKT